MVDAEGAGHTGLRNKEQGLFKGSYADHLDQSHLEAKKKKKMLAPKLYWGCFQHNLNL